MLYVITLRHDNKLTKLRNYKAMSNFVSDTYQIFYLNIIKLINRFYTRHVKMALVPRMRKNSVRENQALSRVSHGIEGINLTGNEKT